MALNFENIHNALADRCKRTGLFGDVIKHEPRSAPSVQKMSLAVWCDNVRPAGKSSGLAATAASIIFSLRIYLSMTYKPEDRIDSVIWDAYDVLMEDFAGDFDLGGHVKAVNLQGAEGQLLQGQAGYIVQDQKLFRIVELSLPLTINDAWSHG